jgi:hypothetical protein
MRIQDSKGGLVMLRFATALALGVALLGLTGVVLAADKPETLEGKITCAKCDLGIEKQCATVIKVGDTVYYFAPASNKKYHKDTCQEGKEGKVTGTVKEEKGKKVITVTKLEYKK